MRSTRVKSQASYLRAIALGALLFVPLVAHADTVNDKLAGMTFVLGAGANQFPCIFHVGQFHALMDAVSEKDGDGVEEAMRDGIYLSEGDHMRILEVTGSEDKDLRIRLLNGKNAHKACWIPTLTLTRRENFINRSASRELSN